MQKLLDLGLSEIEIKNILEMCPNILNLTNIDINNKIEILKSIDCNNRHIKNILISNPYYLDRSDDDILNLIKKLIEIRITDINLLFDSNPYFLNKDAYEIEEYINFEISKGYNLEDIIDKIETNPYIVDVV